ncbi:nuclear transport factor 2 family protein [Uliginosibacterium sp. H1]|uniref:nuclear transport factor 2 family protein n=1 Tax=Uliginosibacterium sp. H1 TaxID=3114757 RepID=UPI002E18A1D8|nr:nuclear transport factor 2 family protein [Uliginosibacterium sp. H1]
MQTASEEVIALENRFWQAIMDEDADTAVSLLDEPALMVSSHGAMKFDHAGYRKMAEMGSMTVKEYRLSDMQAVFPNADTAVLTYRVSQTLSMRDNAEEVQQNMADSSVWTRRDGAWRCVMHTETPVDKTQG